MKKLIAGVLAGLVLAGGVAFAQNVQTLENVIMRVASPYIRFAGTLKFQTLGGTDIYSISQTGAAIGSGGSTLTKIVVYSTTLTPTSFATTACSPSSTFCTTTQTFSGLVGLSTSDKLFINSPQVTSHLASKCPVVEADVSATNTIRLKFAKVTTAACTPQSGTYKIFAVRS